eukprot:1088062-Prorocentrum_minimum.AAC.1
MVRQQDGAMVRRRDDERPGAHLVEGIASGMASRVMTRSPASAFLPRPGARCPARLRVTTLYTHLPCVPIPPKTSITNNKINSKPTLFSTFLKIR